MDKVLHFLGKQTISRFGFLSTDRGQKPNAIMLQYNTASAT